MLPCIISDSHTEGLNLPNWAIKWNTLRANYSKKQTQKCTFVSTYTRTSSTINKTLLLT